MFADPDAAYVLGFSVRALNELTLTLLTPTLTLTPTLARPEAQPYPYPSRGDHAQHPMLPSHHPSLYLPPVSREVIMLNTDAHSSQIKNKMTKVTRT